MELKKSDVFYNDLLHTYWNGEKRLSGITGILHKYLFPDMYKAVSEEVLNAAAERGSRIHEAIQILTEGGVPTATDPEIDAYKRMLETSGIKMAYSEFVVSDNEHFASPIDLISEDGDLYDIKTTSVLNKEYLRWQLSIYKYFLRMQTGYEAKHLYGIHLRGDKCKVVELQPVPEDAVISLLECAARGDERFSNPLEAVAETDDERMSRLADLEVLVADIEAQAKEAKAKRDELRAGLLKEMTDKGLTKMDTDRMTISVKAAYTREGIDAERLKAEQPSVYEQYKKITNIKESLTIKIK